MNTDTFPVSRPLGSAIDALRAAVPNDDHCHMAQRRLVRRLDAQRPQQRATRLAWAGTAATLALAVALLALPLLSGYQGNAFAAVQKHLTDYRTLHATITQRAGGIDLPTIRVWTDHAGNTRSDIGDSTSVVVNVDKQELLILLHGPHKAMRMPLDDAGSTQARDPLGWLDAVRKFQGQATRLQHSRMIDGVKTNGWLLDTASMHITLWADSQGMPRAVDIDGQTRLQQKITIELDQPIDQARFSTTLPAGYTLAQED